MKRSEPIETGEAHTCVPSDGGVQAGDWPRLQGGKLEQQGRVDAGLRSGVAHGKNKQEK